MSYFRIRHRVASFGCALALAGVAAGGEPCHYTWVRVPSPPGANCRGRAINILGHVAGRIENSGDTTRAFVWSPESGRVELPMVPGFVSMQANGINDLGHVAGDMWGPNGWAGFVWDGQNYTIINLPSWANMIEVSGINDADQVVGTVINGITGPLHPFVWQNGVLTDLTELTGSTTAFGRAINHDGQMVGQARGAQVIRHAWEITEPGTLVWLEEPAGFTDTDAVALNNNGFVAGDAKVADPIHFEGVVWTPWGINVVPPGSNARDTYVTGVNDAGRAVGFYYGGGLDSPIAWQQGLVTQLRPLIIPPVSNLHLALDINHRGQIIALDNGTIVLNPVWLTGDLTGDCHVSIDDLTILLSDFGSPVGSFPQGDVDGDGQVGLADLTLLLARWGA